MLNVANFSISHDEHQKRQKNHISSGQELKQSIYANMRELGNIRVCMELPDNVPMASNPKWANSLFGAVNTVQKSGCIALATKLLLDTSVYQKQLGNREVSVGEVISEVVTKGYRLWKLENRQKTLNFPIPTVENLHQAFPDDVEIQSCSTLEEIYQVAGTPIGIGGSMFFMDNAIASVSGQSIEIAKDTRIHCVEQIIDNLSQGYSVPVRVNNSIYHSNPCLTEGHYITLYGLENGYATIVDTSIDKHAGIRIIPAMRFFNAMLGDDNLICAWNTRLQ